MAHTQTLDDLLARWDEAYHSGQELSAEDLCGSRASPDLVVALREHIGAVKHVDGLLRTQCWQSDRGRADTNLGMLEPASEHRYTIVRHLAQGGLGTVFIAEDQELRREVALKFILDRYAGDPACLASFRTEREITARMQHPGIVPVYGVGQLPSGRPFYVMRYVKGRSLKTAIEEHYSRPPGSTPGECELEFRKLLSHFVAACQTVAYAHNRCVINRDLKPEHILLGRYGETLVVDWGLAMHAQPPAAQADASATTILADPTTSNSSGGGAGTLMFMSPEQAAGSVQLTPATDIYSLGATLYALITGRLPFAGSNSPHELRQRVIRGDFPPPRQANSRCPRALAAICDKAMAGRPEDRYPTAELLAADIERYLADQPISVLSDTRAEAAVRWARRHRSAAVTGLIALTALALISLVAALALVRSWHAANLARQASLHTSATFAAKMLSREVEHRWLALEVAASDPQLHELLRRWDCAADKQGGQNSLHQEFDAWLAAQRRRFDGSHPAFSWVVTDRRGILLGRQAADGKSFHGESFAHRTYFHGGEHELTTEYLASARPIVRPHLSPVFENRSFADEAQRQRRLTATCSVPVRDGGQIVGVLLMSLEITAFEALRLDPTQQRVALLIDSRPDWKDDRGLVLFHGAKAAQKHKLPNAQWPVIDNVTLRQMLTPTSGGRLTSGVLPKFHDPEFQEPGGTLAGFAPVWVRPDRQQPQFSGWFVVVCEGQTR